MKRLLCVCSLLILLAACEPREPSHGRRVQEETFPTVNNALLLEESFEMPLSQQSER